MQENDLHACQPRAYKVTTISGAAPTPAIADHVKRDFTSTVPGTRLVGDITYVRTWTGWLYLATVIDCHTKAVVGWSMAEHMRTDLICEAITMAAANVELAPGAVFHSDRGTQYQCRLVKRVVGGPAGWFGGCIAVDGVRASWLENCDGNLFSRPGDRVWVGVCSAARGFPRCIAHVVCVALWGENTDGSVIRRRRMCSVRVKDNRSGSISTVSAASDMKARIA